MTHHPAFVLLSVSVLAALFSRPVVGVVVGALAAVTLAVLSLSVSGFPVWCPVSVLFVALSAAAVRKWFLAGRRPDLTQALLLGVVFQLLHFSLDVLFGYGDIAWCCGTAFADFLPEALVLMGLSAVACLATRSAGRPGSLLFSQPSRLLAIYLVIIGVQVWVSAYDSFAAAERRGRDALKRLEYVFESQIDFMLHHDAVEVVESMGTLRKLTEKEAAEVAESVRYDEICLVNPQGKVESCNDAKLFAFDFAGYEKTRRYLSLGNEPEAYIGEPFRASGLDGVEVKYGGVGFPDGSGFVQLGYYRSRLERDFLRYFAPIFHEQIGYASGDYYLIVDTGSGRITVADLEHDAAEGRLASEVGLSADSVYAQVFGEWCHLRHRDVGGHRIFCVTPLSASFGDGLYDCAVLGVLLFVFVFGLRVVTLRFRLQQEKIDRMRAEADERQRRDLDMAARIQSSSLPTAFPQGDGFAFSAKMKPAKEVGGDFFDFYRLADGRVVFTVADVSGKGVPAAMFMMKAKGTLKSSMFRCDTLAAAVAVANDRLADNNEAEMFVTAWTGVFDPASRTVDFVNAGHNPPFVRRADGTVEGLRQRGGPALGVFPGCTYRAGRVTLGPGDALVVYTDGVTEAQDVAGGFYGEARLERFLAASGGDRVAGLFADVAAFVGAADQADDLTALALDVTA